MIDASLARHIDSSPENRQEVARDAATSLVMLRSRHEQIIASRSWSAAKSLGADMTQKIVSGYVYYRACPGDDRITLQGVTLLLWYNTRRHPIVCCETKCYVCLAQLAELAAFYKRVDVGGPEVIPDIRPALSFATIIKFVWQS